MVNKHRGTLSNSKKHTDIVGVCGSHSSCENSRTPIHCPTIKRWAWWVTSICSQSIQCWFMLCEAITFYIHNNNHCVSWQSAGDDLILWHHQMETFPASLALFAGNSPVSGSLMFSLICVWTNGWINTRDAGDLRRYRANYDVTVITRAS